MNQYSKASQTKKTRKTNPKKMSKPEYKKKCIWLFSKYPKCQICLINKAEDAHHADFGAGGKDDRTIIAVCQNPCHHEIHHGKNGVAVSTENLIELGLTNHEEWEHDKDLVW